MVDFSQSYQPNGFDLAGGSAFLDPYMQMLSLLMQTQNQNMARYNQMGNAPIVLDPNLNYNQELASARAAAGANATPAQIAQVFASRTGLPPQVALSAVQQATSYQQTTGQALDDAQFGRLLTNAAQTSIPTMDYTQLMAQLSGQLNGEPTFPARQWQDQFGLASEAQQAQLSGQQPGKERDIERITQNIYRRYRAQREAGGGADYDLSPDQWVSWAIAEGVPAAQAQKWANLAYSFRATNGRAPTAEETAAMGRQVAASMPTEDTRRWEIEQTGFLDGQATMSREKQTADLANQRVAMYGYDPEAMSAGGSEMARGPLDTGAGYTRQQFGTRPVRSGMGQPPEIGPVTKPRFGTQPIPGQTGVGQPTPGVGRVNDTPAWGTTGGLSQGMSRTLAPQGGPVQAARQSQDAAYSQWLGQRGGTNSAQARQQFSQSPEYARLSQNYYAQAGLSGPTGQQSATPMGGSQVSPDLSWQNAAMGQQAPDSLLALLQKSQGQNQVTPGGPGGYAMTGPNTVTPIGQKRSTIGGYSVTPTGPPEIGPVRDNKFTTQPMPGRGTPPAMPPEYGPVTNPQFGTTPGTPGAQPGFNPYDPYDPNWVRQAPGLPSPGGYYGDANRARNLYNRQQQGNWGQGGNQEQVYWTQGGNQQQGYSGGNPYLNIGNQPISSDYQKQIADLTGTVLMPGGQQLQSLPSQQWNRQFGLNQDTVYGGQGMDLLRLASQLRGPENAYQNANMLAQARGMPAYNYAQGLLGQGRRSGGFGAWGQTQAPTMGGLLGQGGQGGPSYPTPGSIQPTTWDPRQVNNMSPSERKMQDSYLQSAGVNPEDAWDTYDRARPQGNIAMRTRFS